MSEESYEYECMRAELLGLPKPEKRPEPLKQDIDDEGEDEVDDEVDEEAAKEIHENKEHIKRVGGGLEELNSILSVTQKKLNTFKTNFGSLKDLFRQHLSGDNGTVKEDTSKDSSTDAVKDEVDASNEGTPGMTKKLASTSKVANDMGQEMESQVDKLDALVTKAEYAEMSMASQNKQMRKFLK